MPESLKNILLVMSSGGYLVPPSENSEQTPQQSQLWTETWTRLDNFLPGLMPELFPEQTQKPAAAPEQTEPLEPQNNAVPRPDEGSQVAEPQAA